MPIPSSGPLSWSNLQSEFGGADPISISEYYRSPNGLTASSNTGVPLSGAISMSQFYGAAAAISITLNITANTSNYKVLQAVINALGYTPTLPVIATLNIASGVTVSSTTTGEAAIDTQSSWVAGSTLNIVNNGNIYGCGGAGGAGGSASGDGANGSNGGDALAIRLPTIINNTNGNIFGGGGGGAGGGGVFNWRGVGGGGGGGGRGSNGGSAGAAGTNQSPPGWNIGSTTSPQAGTAGTSSGAGNRGNGGSWGYNNFTSFEEYENYTETGGQGGSGGDWGAAGAAGSTGTWAYNDSLGANDSGNGNAGGSGGAAGFAIRTNGNSVTWSGGNNSTQVRGGVG